MVNGWLPVTSFFANSIFFSSSSFLFSNCFSILLCVTCKQVSCCRICFWTDTISVSGLARAFLNFGIGGSDAGLMHEDGGLTGFSPNISRKLEGYSSNRSYEKGRPPLVLRGSTNFNKVSGWEDLEQYTIPNKTNVVQEIRQNLL